MTFKKSLGSVTVPTVEREDLMAFSGRWPPPGRLPPDPHPAGPFRSMNWRVGAEGFHIASLTFRIQFIERESFSRSR